MRRILAAATILLAFGSTSPGEMDTKARVANTIAQIQRADYEGNRAELKRLYQELAPFVKKKKLASRVRYWRGFALWRRAMNGFNDAVDPKELEQDLEFAVQEFKASAVADPSFVEAKVGEGSCLSNLLYLNQGNPPRLQELIPQVRQVLNEAGDHAPDNPRLAWVQGPNFWYGGQQSEENQNKAVHIYERALGTIRKQGTDSRDPLEPNWGEPELLMNLAWSNLHRTVPDLPAARSYAESALSLVPYWHYVRDILIPQIQNAIDAKSLPSTWQRP